MTDEYKKNMVIGTVRRLLNNLGYKPNNEEILKCLEDLRVDMFPGYKIKFTVNDVSRVVYLLNKQEAMPQ